jgi:hypothetical protein
MEGRASNRVSDVARVALAGVRLTTGVAGLVAPGFLVKRLDVDPDSQGAATYVFRLFGVRTVLIGLELLAGSPDGHHAALKRGLLIHASDTTAAVVAGWTGRLPRKGAAMTAAISFGNTLLAAIALATRRDDD